MHVLCVTDYYKPAYIYGGPARSVPALCEAMARTGVQMTVFTTNANGPGRVLDVPICQPLNIDGVQVFYFPVLWALARFHPFYSPRLGIACEVNGIKFDAVYIPGDWTYPNYKAGQISIRNNIPYVISPRGSFMTWSMREKSLKKRIYLELIERKLIDSASAIQVTSSLEEEQIHKWNFKPPVVIVPNGIDLSSYHDLPDRGRFRELLNIPSNGTLSLFIGRLHKHKRLDLIIESFAAFAKNKKDSHLLIVGSDDDGSGKAAEEQVRNLYMVDQIHFMGHLNGLDLLQAYVDADLLVLLSYHENFGMVAVEAMAVGLPVLLSKDVGLASEVQNEKAGFAVSSEQSEIVSSWQTILLKPELRSEMGVNGKRLVRERFTTEIIANRMSDLFASICQKKVVQ
jgi:glycosyltransferase involved in cell wall biosynthesis